MKRKKGERRKKMGIILGVIVALVAVMFGFIMFQNQKPQIQLGLKNGQLREIPNKQNAVSTQTAYEDKKIEPLPMKSSVKVSKDAMKYAFEQYGNIVIEKENTNYMYAIATTGTMKYHDDIEVYVDEKKGTVEYRSASRAGYSDMGLNRKRFDELAELYRSYKE